MKATGIVRRIDDLGRMVIPKEIRRTLRIREGDPLEIYTDREGSIVLKKYSPIGEITTFAKIYAESLSQVANYPVLIADRDQIVALAGGFKNFLGKSISKDLEKKLESREGFVFMKETKGFVKLIEEDLDEYQQEAVAPIICEGDIIGAVTILSNDTKNEFGEVELKLVQAAAGFLGKQMEQ